MPNDIGFIFDWDGVVVDSSKQHELSWDYLADAEGLALFDGHFKQGFGKRNEFIIPNILKWTDDPREVARLSDLKEVYYRKIVADTGLEALPGVKAFVAQLVREKRPRAVGSSTPRENIEAVLKLIELEGAFEHIVAAADVSVGKPDPEVFLKASQKIAVNPSQCVVFEDSFSGIEAGLAAGMTVVGLATTNPIEALRDAGVHLAAHSFNEFSVETLIELVSNRKVSS